MNGLAVQFLGEVEQHLGHIAARLQPVRARTVIPLLETLQFELKPQHLDAEFFGLPLVLLRAALLFFRALLLFFPSLLLPVARSHSRPVNAPSPSAIHCPPAS
jgi:hypothetical protein